MLGFPVVVHALVRARLGVSGINVQRGAGVAADERERQDQDKAAGEQRLHKDEGYGLSWVASREFVGCGIAQIPVSD